jgi:hypothetical protein
MLGCQLAVNRMSFWKRLFGVKKPPPTLSHPLFGEITFSRHDGWMNRDFQLWGFSKVELIIDGLETGSSRKKRSLGFAT